MKNGRRPPVRRGQIPNFGYRNLNPPRERNMELDESYNSFTQLQDDDIEPIEENGNHDQREKVKKWAATCIVVYAAHVAFLCSLIRGPTFENDSGLEELDYGRHSIVKRLTKMKEENCRNQLRMGKNAFANLVYILKGRGLLRDTARSRVEEQVAKFLYIIGHNQKFRVVGFNFRRSGETISRHFHLVLRAIISLEELFLKQPNGDECSKKIQDNQTYWPYFKNCVGAIDGTHIRLKVSNSDAPRYRGRKSFPTQNILVASNFDLMFTYVLPGWEGSASDSRILNDSLTREIDRLIVPEV
ncbi:PREDICTED: uncharacterized protein LOC105961482 isoform X2 [Erythranthe guttata]|uniref:uncharacterized protein LOC105961482 isoform X2 n=1 Tax=Erythranthe guttata TaxID=4155 RepID=UPI00064DB1EF|nr:PREDICTED: uncharacterized protein LOC105961482 isoform X2 [Erythranthe guttata]|eukprot:XP_012841169.1 PREDICTED: uncharacterized protein LOC105961482 isoform X2 [Erythranthe guttata]